MNRWLLSLFLIFSLWILPGTNKLTKSLPTLAVELNSRQIDEGEKVAKKAFQASGKGDFAKAETYWTELIEQFPDNPAVWSNRGNVRIGQYKLSEAISDFDRSIEIAPEYPDAYLNRGIAYE